jgi:hypothetical protein
MNNEADRINGWRCPYCERKNRLDGDGRCETPNCDGVHPTILRRAEEFPPDA